MRTLCECLDALQDGALPQLADLLVQRLKALEVGVAEGRSGVADNLELTPRRHVTLASLEEQTSAAKAELAELKLREAMAKAGR